MPDIQLRFHHDVLVLSAPAEAYFAQLGQHDDDGALSLLVEPEVYEEFYALQNACGVQCLVTDTASFTPAQLAHGRLERDGEKLARAAIDIVAAQKPQHILVEIGPCGLPLDPSSKASLNETRDQYTRAAKFFSSEDNLIDAFFLNNFDNITDLKCALMGVRKVSDKPIFASVNVSSGDATIAGDRGETLAEAVSVMAEYGAQVAGFSIAAVDIDAATALISIVRNTSPELPILVQLDVVTSTPDDIADAAAALTRAGAQFLRATGKSATPSYAAALVGSTIGDQVVNNFDSKSFGIFSDKADVNKIPLEKKAWKKASFEKKAMYENFGG